MKTQLIQFQAYFFMMRGCEYLIFFQIDENGCKFAVPDAGVDPIDQARVDTILFHAFTTSGLQATENWHSRWCVSIRLVKRSTAMNCDELDGD